MSMKIIYVAGPIGSTTDYHERFAVGCEEVKALGHAPVSPLVVAPAIANDENSWLEVMKADIRALLSCDGIYLLRGWENSRGARLEKLIADGLGYLMLYQPEESDDK